jgi:hypothetical protein
MQSRIVHAGSMEAYYDSHYGLDRSYGSSIFALLHFWSGQLIIVSSSFRIFANCACFVD